MKTLTKVQKRIINDHLMIEGSENFDFYSCEDGRSVLMVNKNTGDEIAITMKAFKELNPEEKLMSFTTKII